MGRYTTIEGFVDGYSVSTRTTNILFNMLDGSQRAEIAPIKTPYDLLEYPANQLLKARSLGVMSLLELNDAFEQEGHSISGIERYVTKYNDQYQKYKQKNQDQYQMSKYLCLRV